MPVSITWNTTGVWGTGIGVIGDPAIVDANFYSLKQAVEALEADRPQPDNIASITTAASGTQWFVHLDSGAQLGPLPIPVLQFRDRGEWVPFGVYAILDVVTKGRGLYKINIAHTAAATFDASAASAPIAATAIVAGGSYKIATVGTTDFTLIGATSNTVDVVFIATDAGTGTGTAGPLIYNTMIGPTVSDGQVVSETTTARTLSLDDDEAYLRTSNGAAVAIEIPANADVAFGVGATVAVEQAGAGAATFVAGAGVTVNVAATHLPTTNGQFAVMQAKKVGENEWTVFGNLVPA